VTKPLSLTLVSSPQNDVYKSILNCLEGQGDEILVHGIKLISEILARSTATKLELKTLVSRESFFREMTSATPSSRAMLGLANFSKRYEQPITRLSLKDALFENIDPIGVPDAIAVFTKPQLRAFEFDPVGPTLLAATQNPINLGALVRSASAFGFKNLVILKEAAQPYHPRTIRGSMGHVFDFNCFQGPSIYSLQNLSESIRQRLVTLDLNGTPLEKFKWPEHPIVLVGEEGRGVPESILGQRVTIPHLDHVESLNAAVSAGIAFYDYFKK
jgi:TrmH family RNA methyltransferase